jgi:hypothetical protein
VSRQDPHFGFCLRAALAVCAAVHNNYRQQKRGAILKFLGAMCFGLLTMLAAAYLVARTANQRREDFAALKSLSSRIFTSVKNYCRDLLNPDPEAETATKD